MRFLIILRSVFFAVCAVIYTVLTALFAFITFPVLRRSSILDKCVRLWARLIFWTCRIKITVEGLENLEQEKVYIFFANHQSSFDIPACVAVIPARLRMLTKKELFRIPVFGWGIWAAGHIRIDRKNRERAIESLEHASKRLEKEDISPLVYPEGTRSPDGNIHAFKKGGFVLAIKSGRPIVPVAIVGSRAVLPKRSLSISPGHIHVIIDKPIPTDNYSFSDRDALAQKCRQVIEKRYYNARNSF